MTQDNFDEALLRLTRRPFKPFVIALNDGTRFEVDFPNALLYRPGIGRVIFLSPGGTAIDFDHDSVVKIIDAPAVDADK